MPSKVVNACRNHDIGRLMMAVDKDTIETRDLWGRPPIYYAVRYGFSAGLDYLVRIGADVHRDPDLLLTAIRTQSVSNVQNILRYWKSAVDTDEYLPLIFSIVSNETSVKILELFCRHFLIISLKGQEGLLCHKVRVCHLQWLLANQVCLDILQAARFCLVYRRLQCFYYLVNRIKHQEQLNHVFAPTVTTYTLFSLCSVYGSLPGIKMLLSKGADHRTITINNRGETVNAVMALVGNESYNRESTAQKLAICRTLTYLLRILDVNWQNSRGQTALMLAERERNGDLIEILMLHGANTDAVDMTGRQSADYR